MFTRKLAIIFLCLFVAAASSCHRATTGPQPPAASPSPVASSSHPGDASQPTSQPDSIVRGSKEPVYRGEPLGHWIKALKDERDLELVAIALSDAGRVISRNSCFGGRYRIN
jgi:hypothetical protein